MLTLHAAHGEGQSREGARATGCTRVQRRGCLPPVLKHFNILTLVHANWTSSPSPAFSHCFSYAQMTPLSPCISAQLHYFPPSRLTCRFLRRASHCLLHRQCKVSIRRVRRGRGRRRKREVQEEAMQHGGEPCSDLLGEEEGEEKPSSIWWSRDASAALIGVEWEVKLILTSWQEALTILQTFYLSLGSVSQSTCSFLCCLYCNLNYILNIVFIFLSLWLHYEFDEGRASTVIHHGTYTEYVSMIYKTIKH